MVDSKVEMLEQWSARNLVDSMGMKMVALRVVSLVVM